MGNGIIITSKIITLCPHLFSQRHAEHLVSKGRWHRAILHLVAARQFNAALNLLLQHELYDLAFLFRMACIEVRVRWSIAMD